MTVTETAAAIIGALSLPLAAMAAFQIRRGDVQWVPLILALAGLFVAIGLYL